MNKFNYLFFVTIFCLLLDSCSTTVISTDAPVSTTSTLSTLAPIATKTRIPTATTTPEPDIELTQIKQWAAEYSPRAWFAKSDNLVMLSSDKLEVYKTSTDLLWSHSFTLNDYGGVGPALAVSPDDKYIIGYNSIEGVNLFDASTGKPKAKSGQDGCLVDDWAFNVVAGKSNRLFIAFNGNNALIANPPIQVSVWQIEPLGCIGKMITIPVQESRPDSVYAMKLNKDDTLLALVTTQYYMDLYNGWVSVWGTRNYKQTCEIPGIYAAFRPSNNLLAVASNEGNTVSYWDAEKCKLVSNIKIPSYSSEQEMDFTPDGKYLILRRTNFQIFDADTGELVYKNKMNITAGSLFSISPDGKYFFANYNESGQSFTTLWRIDRK